MKHANISKRTRSQSGILGVLAVLMLLACSIQPVSAVPPDWAPAHGYRSKYKHQYKHGAYYALATPIYIHGSACNRENLGGVLGGIIGGIIGHEIGEGRKAAVIGGTIIGVLVGDSIGRSMNQVDQRCTGQVLEYVPDRQPVEWVNPDTGRVYRSTPLETYQVENGQYCREYITEAVVGGKTEQIYGTACRQPDGSWKAVQ